MAKKAFLLGLALAVVLPCFSKNIQLMKEKKKKKGSAIKSLEDVAVDVEADYDESSRVLALDFYKSMGYVFVEVRTAWGEVVYGDVVNAANGFHYSASLEGLEEGYYILSVSGKGSSYEGGFDVE